MSSCPLPTGLLDQSPALLGVPGVLAALLVLLLAPLLHTAVRVLLRRQARRLTHRLLSRVPSTGDPVRDRRLRRAVLRTHLTALEGGGRRPWQAHPPRAATASGAVLTALLAQLWGPLGLLTGAAALVLMLAAHAAAPYVEGALALRGTLRELARLPRTGDPAVDADRMREIVRADRAVLRILNAGPPADGSPAAVSRRRRGGRPRR
ncbi:hypothetical protein GL263_05115 [Streptomyces durbertensis]|uniref:Uncharacterized protein n=1 Tax=Streptomyces durbertensis TaxID=2448886 RepID=A0ABR6EC86_9ACTN|nr:hypothetical protein [Streptomyces durbertensis]MBB1242946.1 hypothetical protein [Streptomyces durbertensis]